MNKRIKDMQVPYDLVVYVAESRSLPLVNFAAGGISTPADAALMMELGCNEILVGSGIFKSSDSEGMVRAIVEATENYHKPEKIVELSKNLVRPMKGVSLK